MRSIQRQNAVDLITFTLGCSQAEFARRMNVGTAQVYAWRRRGYITPKFIKRAVEVSGLPAHLLNPYIPAPTFTPHVEVKPHDE